MSLRRTLLLAYFAIATITSSGCSGSGNTGQVVLGIVTDLPWNEARFDVRVLVFKPSADGSVQEGDDEYIQLSTDRGLPGTYVLQSDTTVIRRVQVSAVDQNDYSREIVGRSAVVTIIPGEVHFIRLGLVKSCVGMTCSTQKTCADGECAPSLVRTDDIVPFIPQDATTVECKGPSQLVSTTTGMPPLPVRGTGICRDTRVCREGSCRVPIQGP